MNLRLLVSFGAAAIAIAVASCSSGLGNNLPADPTAAPPAAPSANAPVGLDLGVDLSDPAADAVVAGVVVPPIGARGERDVVLTVFTTADPAGDGATANLSRDVVSDSNGEADVFVAAVSAQDIDEHAFSQSLAGKFRHPRCATCHSMASATTTAFVSAAATGEPHAGGTPGAMFPANNPAACEACHVNSTSFPVDDWKAPDSTFDLRTESVTALNARAQIPPTGDLEHFKGDPRVLWALDSGILPTVGGRNGIADDDHDGVDEPTDRDGKVRTVPGGSTRFIEQIEAWEQAGFPATAADAVRDVTLVSRAQGGAAAGNGASTKPQVRFVPNPTFSAPGVVGTLYVAYQSDASDLVAGDTNGATDVFRTAVDLVADASGDLDLQVNGAATLVSAGNGGANEGDAASTNPVIGGANGEIVAFQSLASDLIASFTDGNGAGGYDVYVRDLGSNTTKLISHNASNQATGGDGSSDGPSLDATGAGVAFESDASDLVATDANGVRDVFYSDAAGFAPFVKTRASVSDVGAEATGGASGSASVYVAGGGRALIAFQSDATNLAPTLGAASNVYLFDSDQGVTILLNQRRTASGQADGDGDATDPVIGPDGAYVAFASAASNIDVLRTDDENGAADVFLVDVAQALNDNVLPYRYSLTTVEAADANGGSSKPQFGTFASPSSSFGVGFSVYQTAATNLGNADSTDLIVAFLDETSGVLADFTVDTTSGAAPLTVQFTDASTGTPTAWEWDFDGDGVADSTEQSPTFTYTTPGTYTVRLTASNSGTSSSVTKADLITAVGLPTADFSGAPTSGTAPLTVNFTDLSTGDPTIWDWDFGDGTAAVFAQNPSHVFAAPGQYTVRLKATNVAGSTDEIKTDYITVFSPVSAGFTATPTTGTVPFSVNFTNTSTGATSYVWDFGDGSATVATPSPSHTFSSNGSFTVTLTATGPGGVDTATAGITANGAVSASFTITIGGSSVSSGYEASTVTLDASSSSNATSYAWDLDNDGTNDRFGAVVTDTVTSLFPTTSQTAYTVRLTATGPGGSGSTTLPFTSVADSEALTVNAIADNTIYQDSTNNSHGAGTRIIVGRPAGTVASGAAAFARRGLVRFSVSALPAGATINTATLRLVNDMPVNTGPETIRINRLTQSWFEGTSNAGAAHGIGQAAAGGGATWIHRITPATSWATAGGAFVASVTGTLSVDASGTYDSTSLASDVQAWVDGLASNHGWLLRSDETAPDTAKRFESREGSTPPQLIINFTRALP